MKSFNLEKLISKDYSPHGLHKFKLYYEELTQSPYVMRKITFMDDVWDLLDSVGAMFVSATRFIFRKVVKE